MKDLRREFSEAAKEKLLGYVSEVVETDFWGKIGDAISDAWNCVGYWLGHLSIDDYVNNLDAYHKKIIDKNDSSAEQINKIFSDVQEVDKKYSAEVESETDYLTKIVEFVKDLGKAIDPSGGNLEMSKIESVLQSDLINILNCIISHQEIIEQESFGTDPVAAPTSCDPVNLATGNFIYEYRDLSYAGEHGIYFHRYYNSKDNQSLTMGRGFRNNFDIAIIEFEGEIEVQLGDGRRIRFEQLDSVYRAVKTTEFFLNKVDNRFVLVRQDGIKYIFNERDRISRIEDSNHYGLSFEYCNNYLTKVINDYGDYFIFAYNGEGYLVEVKDSSNRNVKYYYEHDALMSCILSTGRVLNYKYSLDGRITETFSGSEESNILNEYDKKSRVTHQKFGDGSEMFFEYNDEEHSVTQIERNGVKTVFYHDEDYRNTKVIYHDNSTEEFMYNDKGQCIKHTDRMGNSVRLAYDNKGNLVQIIDPIHRRTNYTYDVNNRLLSISVNSKMIVKNTYDSNGNLIVTENALGNKKLYKYDKFGHITRIISPDGGIEEYVYNDAGEVESFKNHYGGITLYEYDEIHRVTKITNPAGGMSCFEYSNEGNLVSETNENGDKKYYKYNDKGLLIEIVDYNGAVTKQSYNAINMLNEYTDTFGNKTTYYYNKMWEISKIVFSNGAEIGYSYDNDNNVTEKTDPLGTVTNYSYDLNGNCISEERNGRSNRFYYDAIGRKIRVKSVNGVTYGYEYDMFNNVTLMDNVDGVKVRMEYDEANNLIRQSSTNGEIREFTYTEDGKVKSVRDEFGRITRYSYVPGEKKLTSRIFPDGTKETFDYDISGNLIIYRDRYGNVIEGKYNNVNQLVGEYLNDELITSYSYDTMGNLKERCDADGNKTKYDYSLKNELVKLVNAEGSEIDFEYDADSNLICKVEKTTNDIRVSRFEYDMIGRVVKCVDACGKSELYEYDCFNNIISKCDKEGIRTKYTYAKTGRINSIEYQDGRVAVFGYDKNNNLCLVDDWIGRTLIENDVNGREKTVKYPDGETVFYTYNTAGKRTSIKYPSGKKVNYEYDSLLRLSKLKTDDRLVEYSYDMLGRLGEKKVSSGLHTTYTYNDKGLLGQIVTNDTDTLLDSYTFEYDAIGRKIRTHKHRSDSVETSGDFSYSYDTLGRLKTVTNNGIIVTEYNYDPYGNRRSMTDNGKLTNYAYNELNQLIKSCNETETIDYSYDGRGNLISIESSIDGKTEFHYGCLNRLEKSINANGDTIDYQYNALGCRVAKKTASDYERYTIDFTKQYNNMLSMCNSDMTQEYIWDRDIVYIDDIRDDRHLYCACDELGSPIRLMAGNTTEEIYDYNPFGQELTRRKSGINPFTFNGYQRDIFTGLYFAQAREYIPPIGRFAARDLVRGEADNINSQNEYLFCEEDPINYVDKNGLFLLGAILIGIGVGALTSLAIDAVSQGIKCARGGEWSWGEFLGAGAEGAILGGVGVVAPAAASLSFVNTGSNVAKIATDLVVTSLGSGVGAAANSVVSQAWDYHTIDGGKVAEEAITGFAFGAVSYGINKGIGTMKKDLFGAKKVTSSTLLDDGMQAAKEVEAAKKAVEDVKKLGYTVGANKRNRLSFCESELNRITKQYYKTWSKEKVISFTTGKSGIVRTTGRNLVNYETVKSAGKTVFKQILPFYVEEGDDPLIYLRDRVNLLSAKIEGKCPIYK